MHKKHFRTRLLSFLTAVMLLAGTVLGALVASADGGAFVTFGTDYDADGYTTVSFAVPKAAPKHTLVKITNTEDLYYDFSDYINNNASVPMYYGDGALWVDFGVNGIDAGNPVFAFNFYLKFAPNGVTPNVKLTECEVSYYYVADTTIASAADCVAAVGSTQPTATTTASFTTHTAMNWTVSVSPSPATPTAIPATETTLPDVTYTYNAQSNRAANSYAPSPSPGSYIATEYASEVTVTDTIAIPSGVTLGISNITVDNTTGITSNTSGNTITLSGAVTGTVVLNGSNIEVTLTKTNATPATDELVFPDVNLTISGATVAANTDTATSLTDTSKDKPYSFVQGTVSLAATGLGSAPLTTNTTAATFSRLIYTFTHKAIQYVAPGEHADYAADKNPTVEITVTDGTNAITDITPATATANPLYQLSPLNWDKTMVVTVKATNKMVNTALTNATLTYRTNDQYVKLTSITDVPTNAGVSYQKSSTDTTWYTLSLSNDLPLSVYRVRFTGFDIAAGGTNFVAPVLTFEAIPAAANKSDHLNIDATIDNVANISGTATFPTDQTYGHTTATKSSTTPSNPVTYHDRLRLLSEGSKAARNVTKNTIAYYESGDVIEYTITVTNKEWVALTTFDIADFIPVEYLVDGSGVVDLSTLKIKVGANEYTKDSSGVSVTLDTTGSAIKPYGDGFSTSVDTSSKVYERLSIKIEASAGISLAARTSSVPDGGVMTIKYRVQLKDMGLSLDGVTFENEYYLKANSDSTYPENGGTGNDSTGKGVVGNGVCPVNPTGWLLNPGIVKKITKLNNGAAISEDTYAAKLGDTVEFTITVKNNGNGTSSKPLLNPEIADVLPAGLTYVADSADFVLTNTSGSSTLDTTSNITYNGGWNFNTTTGDNPILPVTKIAVGDSFTITYKAEVTDAFGDVNTSLINTATLYPFANVGALTASGKNGNGSYPPILHTQNTEAGPYSSASDKTATTNWVRDTATVTVTRQYNATVTKGVLDVDDTTDGAGGTYKVGPVSL
ncbi:MAG: DUF11 domain-containing protein, partial [Oscillospiraceae bacterium]|nr:DUF11 domain-containing protein [Oscillospiraceae bacterium]